jgi:hypothetical protein
VTASTCGQSLRGLASFARGNRLIRTICALRRAAPWDKRSAMNSPYRSVGGIIASCTDRATRRNGGSAKGLTQHRRRGRFGSKAIRCPASTVAPRLHRTMLPAHNYRGRVYLPKPSNLALTEAMLHRAIGLGQSTARNHRFSEDAGRLSKETGTRHEFCKKSRCKLAASLKMS